MTTPEPTPETKPPGAVPLQRLVQRLGDLERMESGWRKERAALLIEVGRAMRCQRESAKVSLRELSRRLGCSAPFLSDMELGRRKYSIEWCRKAFSSLNIDKSQDPEAVDPSAACSACGGCTMLPGRVDDDATNTPCWICNEHAKLCGNCRHACQPFDVPPLGYHVHCNHPVIEVRDSPPYNHGWGTLRDARETCPHWIPRRTQKLCHDCPPSRSDS